MSDQHFSTAYGADAPENYERFFVTSIGKPLAQDLLDVAALTPGERVLDVGCGTGIVARLAAEQVGPDGSVTGLDVNPGMLRVARASTPDNARIEWHEASAEDMSFADESFDVVLCQLSLQFVPDRGQALREMRRVLVPGGRVALTVPGPTTPLFGALAEAMGRHIQPDAAGFVRAVFSLHDTDAIQRMLDEAGFRDVAVEADTKALRLPPARDFLWQYVHGTPLSGLVAQADDDARAALEQDVLAAWEPHEHDGALDYRQRVVTAQASR